MVSYLLQRGFAQPGNRADEQEIFPPVFLPYGNMIFYDGIEPLEQPNFNSDAIEGYCRYVDEVFLGTVSKPLNAKAIDMVPQGVVMEKPADAQKIDLRQTQAFYEYRAKVTEEQDKQRTFVSNKIIVALKKAHMQKQLNANNKNIQTAIDTVLNALITKYEIYSAAIQHQKTRQYVNCGEYADHASALFLRAQLENENIGTIQRFRVSLGQNGLNHAFVVLNSGITPVTIENNPDAVAAVLADVDNHPAAQLCDFGYNREVGSFHEVRDRNKFYGKNISHPWTCIDIVAIEPHIDLSSIPEAAVELRKIIMRLDDDINQKMRTNIPLPEHHEKQANKQ